ncbi:nucleoside transporter C-terminal domain-containing protein, partial [Staphylococcus pasteuri_A]
NQSFFEMLGEYILDGFNVSVIVGAMLIGYIAIIALINGLVSGGFSLASGGAIKWDFQNLIGFVFAPFAFLAGVTWNDAVQSGSV